MSRAHQRYRQAALALTFFTVIHVAALLAMALVLEPGLRPTVTVAERAAYVARHPWAWRLGWLPWQLSALSNLLFSVSLARWLTARPGHTGIGVRWAQLSIVLTIAAAIPEQWGEFVLVKDYVGLAQSAGTEAGLRAFAETERWIFLMTGPYANLSYVAMTLAWIIALTRASVGVDARLMTWLGAVMCMPFVGASFVIYRATRTPDLAGMEQSIPLNTVAFPLLLVWSLTAAVVMRRMHRCDFPHDDEELHRLHRSWLAWVCDLRDLLRPLPFVELRSDVTDVVYLNWMVPAERAERLLPAGLELDRFGDQTAVTVLTYNHGGFGPAMAGPLRKLLLSPRQSNWRFYAKPRGAIYFFKSVLSSVIYTIGSRVLTDGLPAHQAPVFVHERDGRELRTVIEPGAGNAPDLRSTIEEIEERELPADWTTAFDSWDEAVRYLLEQNRAVGALPMLDGTIASNIEIPISVGDVRPAQGTIESAWLAELVDGCTPFCFVVPAVSFRALGEERLEDGAGSVGEHA